MNKEVDRELEGVPGKENIIAIIAPRINLIGYDTATAQS